MKQRTEETMLLLETKQHKSQPMQGAAFFANGNARANHPELYLQSEFKRQKSHRDQMKAMLFDLQTKHYLERN
jgi:hypothetical protein